MGMDFVDFFYRLEKLFGIRLEPEDLFDEWRQNGNDCTAGRLHEIMCEKCRQKALPVPTSSWTRIRLAIARTLACPVKDVKREVWLRRDLGFD